MSELALEMQRMRRMAPLPIEPDQRALAADIPPNVLVHLTELAARRGLSSETWFAGLGINRQQINDPSVRVSYRQARTVIARALKVLREPGLGLLIGRNETIGSFGLLGLAMMTSRNFGEALGVGIENHRICGSLLDVDFAVIDTHTGQRKHGRVSVKSSCCRSCAKSCFPAVWRWRASWSGPN